MIAIIDYGMGNLRSVQKAVQRVGATDARLVSTPQELAGAEKIIFPGVAAIGDAMDQLRQQKLVEPIVSAVRAGVPYLGFCLGLQLLFEVGTEDGEHKGLGLLGGRVERFKFGPELADQRLRIPHMGWNQVQWTKDCPMLRGIDPGAYVYFAHSYYPVPADPSITVTTTDYGYSFASSVWKDNIFATQFHPEKSQAVGLRLLRNFVAL
jgi:glutamine amidotransferase